MAQRRGTKPKRAKSSATKRGKGAQSLKRDNIPRAVLGRETQRQIDRFDLSREAAGRVVHDAASQMSRLMTGHFAEFSADRLVGMLVRLGSDVTITIRHSRRLGRRGKVRVKAG
ncbi:MAG TPA: XRE family transcriptional regulator [Gemmatimonadaceae bacterium]|nr:XRE family transcriptional regulator [Gemmatimonadaceae bacterium]